MPTIKYVIYQENSKKVLYEVYDSDTANLYKAVGHKVEVFRISDNGWESRGLLWTKKELHKKEHLVDMN